MVIEFILKLFSQKSIVVKLMYIFSLSYIDTKVKDDQDRLSNIQFITINID